MNYFSEKEAENFLKKNGFEVIEGKVVNSKFKLKKSIKKVGLPFVMKVYGKRIVHKSKLGGVKTNIRTVSEAIYEFDYLKKIKGSSGVMIQRQFFGKEFFLGIKKTPEFGHVIIFGAGGSKVEEEKDVVFRVSPFDKNEARKMIKETKIGKSLSKMLENCLIENLLKLCEVSLNHKRIFELDINPFTFSKGKGKVVDARIVWD